MSSQYFSHSHLATPLLLKLLLLSCAAATAVASPVSSPEIGNKSGKLNQASTILSNLSPNGNTLQHHHQSSQQQQQKSNSQDAHLNSLSVYANNYDSIATSHNNQQQQHNSNNNNNNFKPSYNYNNNNNYNSVNNKLPVPEYETNFTPMQHSSLASAPAQPVVMHYLPQTVEEGGVQYLQLIPTRPLIVPISSYMPGTAAAQVSADGVNVNAFQQPSTALTSNTIVDFGARSAPLLSAIPTNVAPPAPATLMDIPSTLPYGLQTYAQTLQPYRNYRINREIKSKNLPPSLSLNMNEYLPSVHDGQPQAHYGRGRP